MRLAGVAVALLVAGLASHSLADGEPPQGITYATLVRVDGVGPIKIGMSVKEAEAAVGDKMVVSSLFNEPSCSTYYLEASPRGLRFMTSDGIIVRIDVFGFKRPELGFVAFKTPEGVGLGTLEADVLAAYKDAKVVVKPHFYTYPDNHYIIVTMSDPAQQDLRILFETSNGKISTYRVGRLPEVEYVEGCA